MRSFEIEALEAGKPPGRPARRPTPNHRTSPPGPPGGRTEGSGRPPDMRRQRAAGNAAWPPPWTASREQDSPVRDVIVRAGGQPLEAPVASAWNLLRTDFSAFPVHAGGSAAASARAVDAHATRSATRSPRRSKRGRRSDPERTLAHSTTPVVPQRSRTPVDGNARRGGIGHHRPDDRFVRAAEPTADAVFSTGRPPEAGGVPGRGAAVQRVGGPEAAEETVCRRSPPATRRGRHWQERRPATEPTGRRPSRPARRLLPRRRRRPSRPARRLLPRRRRRPRPRARRPRAASPPRRRTTSRPWRSSAPRRRTRSPGSSPRAERHLRGAVGAGATWPR